MDYGFWFSVSFRFRIPDFRVAQQQAGAPHPNNESEWTWTAKRTQSKRNKQTAACTKQLYYKREKLNVWSQVYRVMYQNTVLAVYCTHGGHFWPRGHDIQHNFTILSLCQRLNTTEAKSRFCIPPKISTFPSNQLYLKTFRLLFFIHSLKWSIRQPRVETGFIM